MPEILNSEVRDFDVFRLDFEPQIEDRRFEGLGIGARTVAMSTSEASSFIGAKYKSLSPARLLISSRIPSVRAPPGVSPTSLLESPVLLTNVKAEPSPTTGTFVMPFHVKAGLGQTRSFSPRSIPSTSIMNDDGNSAKDCVDSDKDCMEVCAEEQKRDTFSTNLGDTVADSDDYIPPGTAAIDECVADEVEITMNQKEHEHTAVQERETDDGYNWRKYGQKLVKGSEFPRSYYKCTHTNCPVKKILERAFNGQIADVIYRGEHNHPKPLPVRRLAAGVVQCSKDSKGQDVETNFIVLCDGDAEGNDLESNEIHEDSIDNDPDSKRRRKEDLTSELSGAAKASLPRVVVQTLSEVDVLDDGYRWRKYGQKVVKGNPNPRSYYKCTNAGCPVRKHIERASNDPKAVITTYEGKHNHEVPAALRPSYESNLVITHYETMGPTCHIQYGQMEERGSISLDLGVGLNQVNSQSQLQGQTYEILEMGRPGCSSTVSLQNFDGNISLGTETTAENFSFKALPLFRNPSCEANLRRMLMGPQVP
ncbi:putative WRKY transcription factor 26 isoform X2 [Wolffia australiana]